MASRVHMGFDEERRSFGKGEFINIRRPSTFAVNDAPSSAQDVTTETVAIQLNYWREVKFKLSDKELAFTGERIINDHIRPAAYALADDIDQKLALLYKDVPWVYDMNDTLAVSDLTGPRRVMFDNRVPLEDPGNVHMMLDGVAEEGFLQLSAFSQQQGAGDVGVNTQRRGSLGTKFGFETFANQNVQTHTPGAMADAAGALVGNHALGATSVTIDGLTTAGTVTAGDSFVIAGNTQRYAITAAATASAGEITVSITPPLVQAYSDNDVATIDVESSKDVQNLGFHRNAFAIATAPLSEMGNALGAQIATVQDPITGLSLRSRLYYVGDSSEVHVALDVLYGVKTLDPNLAVRARHNNP